MVYRNKTMYDNARNKIEPELISILKSNGFDNVRQSNKVEDFNHVDVFGTINGIQCKFDVKDLEANKTYKNYVISENMHDDIAVNHKLYKQHYLACKQYVNGIANGKFIIIPTLAIFPMLIHKTGFWLAPVYDYMKKYENIGKKFTIIG